MNASRQIKEALIAGLVDTDGYISNKYGNISVCTTSQIMATQLQELVRSIGGICKVTSRLPFFRDKNGDRKAGRRAFNVWIYLEDPSNLVTLNRKRIRLALCKSTKKRLHFVSITPSRITETQCITVSHPDGLYITDDYIVTHNSLISLEIQYTLLTGEPLWGSIVPNTIVKKTVHILAEHASAILMQLYQRTGLARVGKANLR